MATGGESGGRTGLILGLFPGVAGTEGDAVAGGLASYDAAETDAAIGRLQAEGSPFVVRGYGVYKGNGRVENGTPPDFPRFARAGRQLEYVLCYRPEAGDLADWTATLRRTLRELGPALAALQVAEEPNNPHAATGGDGSSPDVLGAVVEGVLAAKAEVAALGLPIAVGMNATPSFVPADPFWPGLAARGGPAFLAALDYVGLDFYPDVFRPLPAPDFRTAVGFVLGGFRAALTAIGLPPTLPIRITENGWPTGPDRPPERQAAALEAIVRAVADLRVSLNVTHYEFFALRDAAPSTPGAFVEWGLLGLDYTPKPAFETYRRLIAELGRKS